MEKTGCGGNMNRFVSVKNCYKLCHPYYRQRPADIVDGGTTTEGPSTTPASTTSDTVVVMPIMSSAPNMVV